MMENKEPQILTLIQARVGSSRLPGKVLRPLGGKPVLARMLERVRRAKLTGQIVVVTTTDAEDDRIVHLCESEGFEWFRGHPTDLLDRHYQAWRQYGGDAVVKIPSDCPLIDPKAIDRVIGHFLKNPELDFVSNLHPATYPDGNDVEVMKATALATAFKEAKQPHEREHTTAFLWDNPERFKTANVEWELKVNMAKTHRWVLDYPEDMAAISALFDALYRGNPAFGVEDLVETWNMRSDIRELNEKWLGDGWYLREKENLRTEV